MVATLLRNFPWYARDKVSSYSACARLDKNNFCDFSDLSTADYCYCNFGGIAFSIVLFDEKNLRAFIATNYLLEITLINYLQCLGHSSAN